MDGLVQAIRRAGEILDRTVSVLDALGVVLASTDQRLEGEYFSEVGLLMATTDDFSVADDFSYARLSLGQEENYLLRIDGTDHTSQAYLLLVREWLQATLEDRTREGERSSFLKSVILENELPGDIPLKARDFKVDYARRRVCLLFKIRNEEDQSGTLSLLRTLFPLRHKDYIFTMEEDSIVLLYEAEEGETEDDYAALTTQVVDTLSSELMLDVRAGMGLEVDTLKDLAKSYREAVLSVTIGQIFEPETKVNRYDRLGLGRLIYQLPPTLCQLFLEEVFSTGAYEELDNEILLTIDKFFENNLNGSETSRQLYVHRNTLVYRLDKVAKITNLDLRKFDDAVMFKLASMVRRYLDYLERHRHISTIEAPTHW